eukprot:m51a1_g6520 hypothetical protein (403) ;mRNA; f:278640-280635
MRADVAYLSVLGLSCVPVVYLATLARSRRQRAKLRPLASAVTALASLLLLVFLHLAYLHRLTVPSGIDFEVRSSVLAMDRPSESGYYLFNPSLARYRGSLVLAIREGNLNNCPSFASWLDLRRFAKVDSRVLLARAPDSAAALARPLHAQRTLTNDAEGVFYHGVDDPRVIVGPDNASLYATVVQNNRLFVSTFSDNLEETMRVKVVPQWPGAYPKQKNWMHVPRPQQRAGSLLFVQWLNPLALAELDPATGHARLAFATNRTVDMPAGLRGSTNFIPHPTIPGRYFAIAHEKEELYPPIVISFFKSRMVEIEEREGEWAVTGMSDPFALPSGAETTRVHRIHYPTSMVYESDADKATLMIGMGFMDCSAHIVHVRTADLLALIKPLGAQGSAGVRGASASA